MGFRYFNPSGRCSCSRKLEEDFGSFFENIFPQYRQPHFVPRRESWNCGRSRRNEKEFSDFLSSIWGPYNKGSNFPFSPEEFFVMLSEPTAPCADNSNCCLHKVRKEKEKTVDKENTEETTEEHKGNQDENSQRQDENDFNPLCKIFGAFFKPYFTELTQQEGKTENKKTKATNIKIQRQNQAVTKSENNDSKETNEEAIAASEDCSHSKDDLSKISADVPSNVQTQEHHPFKTSFNLSTVDPRTVKVEIGEDSIKISGKLEKKTVEDGCTSVHSSSVTYERSFPQSVCKENIRASLNTEGILTIEEKRNAESAEVAATASEINIQKESSKELSEEEENKS